MAQSYYLFRSGRLRRRQNTLYLEREDAEEGVQRQQLPIENIRDLYLFGEVDLNTKLLVFLSQHGVPVHIFNHYGFYSGSFYPRESNVSGFLLVRQVEHYLQAEKRLHLARQFVAGSLFHIRRNLAYYSSRGRDLSAALAKLDEASSRLAGCGTVPELMREEGAARAAYYEAFNAILSLEEPFQKRVRRPPDSLVNAFLSFGNSLLYAACLSELYVTQLNPTISYLHEPSERRFSLALDLAEVFKPLLVDRLLFRMVNRAELGSDDVEAIGQGEGLYLREDARKKIVRSFEELLQTTVQHRQLKRPVSYRHFIRLEAYKLIRHLIGAQPYEPLHAWW